MRLKKAKPNGTIAAHQGVDGPFPSQTPAAKTREMRSDLGACVRNGLMREKARRSVAPRFASWRRRQTVFSRVSPLRILSIARHRRLTGASSFGRVDHRCV